jgi:hypothetical protein
VNKELEKLVCGNNIGNKNRDKELENEEHRLNITVKCIQINTCLTETAEEQKRRKL